MSRTDRPVGWVPTMAVAGDVALAPLRAAGWSLRGALSGLPYVDLPAGWHTADELGADEGVDAVAVDGADPSLAALLPELRAAGLLLLLPTPAPLDPEVVRAARAVPEGADAVVGLVARYEPWARTVAAALPLAGGPVVQVTVRGWPRGHRSAAELVDLAASWCGEVVAVVAAPAPLPAGRLPGGEPVAWALLTEGGATVLVSHEGPSRVVRLSFAAARLEAGPAAVRWEAGAAMALPGAYDGLEAAARALTGAVSGGDVPALDWPWPADLSDLLVVARVLEALRTSARTRTLVPVA